MRGIILEMALKRSELMGNHPKQMIYVDFGEEIKEGYLLRRREEVEGEN